MLGIGYEAGEPSVCEKIATARCGQSFLLAVGLQAVKAQATTTLRVLGARNRNEAAFIVSIS
jgi:hypothetical protein